MRNKIEATFPIEISELTALSSSYILNISHIFFKINKDKTKTKYFGINESFLHVDLSQDPRLPNLYQL